MTNQEHELNRGAVETSEQKLSSIDPAAAKAVTKWRDHLSRFRFEDIDLCDNIDESPDRFCSTEQGPSDSGNDLADEILGIGPSEAIQNCTGTSEREGQLTRANKLAALDSEIDRYISWVEDVEQPEASEEALRCRYRRSLAMIKNPVPFRRLLETCAACWTAIDIAGGQLILGERAGLPRGKPWHGIEFGPKQIGNNSPLSLEDYIDAIGGTHVFGSLLLWWCAAGCNSTKFGYSANHSGSLIFEPFWFYDTCDGYCVANDKPVELMCNAVEFVEESLRRLPLSSSDVRSRPEGVVTRKKNELPVEDRPQAGFRTPDIANQSIDPDDQGNEDDLQSGKAISDGPIGGLEFRLCGRNMKLTEVHFNIMTAIWKAWNTQPRRDAERVLRMQNKVAIPIDLFCAEVWGHLRDPRNFSGTLTHFCEAVMEYKVEIARSKQGRDLVWTLPDSIVIDE